MSELLAPCRSAPSVGPAAAIVLVGLASLVPGPVAAAETGEALPPDSLAIEVGPSPGNLLHVTGVVTVPVAPLGRNELGFYNLELSGELRAAGLPYDSFRYRFAVADDVGSVAPIVLTFERRWRAGDFVLALTVRDLTHGTAYRLERPLRLVAPAERVETEAVPGSDTLPGLSSGLVRDGLPPPGSPAAPAVRLLPVPRLVMGRQRVTAVAGEGVTAVRFLVDGREVLTKSRPPYSAELELGPEPRPCTLVAEALTASGAVVGRDTIEVNPVQRPFGVEILRPRSGEAATGRVPVEMRLGVPADRRVERVELFVAGERVGSVAGPPWSGEVRVHGSEPVVLTALATLDDGRTTEDAVLLNARDGVAELAVELVELYTAMVDRRGELVTGLGREEVRVFEDGRAQTIERFEHVDGLPISVALALDTSYSMAQRLPLVSEAAAGFVRSVVGPGDEALLVTFSSAPRLDVPLGSDPRLLVNRLATLEAGGDTALFDSLAFTLRELPLRGQRAVLLLSDGRDRASRTGAAETFEAARRAGVTIYTIGLESRGPSLDEDVLERLARETGGRFFTVSDAAELPGVFHAIEEDLRTRYLIAYYSSSHEVETFRTVQVRVERPGVEARTVLGYYP